MIYKAFTCSFDLYNISNFIINQTFSIINKSFFKLKKHAALCGCYGCHTRTRSRLFWSLVIFTLLYSLWQPYNLCWKWKDFFSLKILLRKPRFIKSKRKSDRLTWWVFKCCCHKIICSRLRLLSSLAMFTLLYSQWDPYKICWRKNYVFVLKIFYFSICLISNKLYWIEDQLADVSTRFYALDLALGSWTVGDLTVIRLGWSNRLMYFNQLRKIVQFSSGDLSLTVKPG